MRCDSDAVHPPEVDHLDTMEAPTIQSHGHLKALLTQVLWGESIGLLPLGNNLFNICFTHWPLVGFGARRDDLMTLSNPGWPKNKIHPEQEKTSGVCSVWNVRQPPARSKTREQGSVAGFVHSPGGRRRKRWSS